MVNHNKEKYPDEPISSELDIRDAVNILCEYSNLLLSKDKLWQKAHETSIAWIKAELHDKGNYSTLADAHQKEKNI